MPTVENHGTRIHYEVHGSAWEERKPQELLQLRLPIHETPGPIHYREPAHRTKQRTHEKVLERMRFEWIRWLGISRPCLR